MGEGTDRREVRRTALPRRPRAQAREVQEVRLLDLSLKGARIEHLDLLHPGAPCHLQLPPTLGSLSLSAQVVWCTVVGRKPSPDGDRQLISRTGLRFTKLTATQQTSLAGTLQELAAGRIPA
jgi:PilZ domain